MLRRSIRVLAGGMVPYHEWHLHEPILVNYEGWRILDNPTMTRTEAYCSDFGGFVRHLDPIIDDPRLTHQQRVCRLYRWALKEMVNFITRRHATKFNMGYKVVRARFEKYRYVTDPGMCDMMVRETQKYLRENCSIHLLRLDVRSPGSIACQTNPLFHPDNCKVYDHWVHPEVMWYDDAKLHRYACHHPMMSGTTECYERYGDAMEMRCLWRIPMMIVTALTNIFVCLSIAAAFYTPGSIDPAFDEWNKHFDHNLRQAIEAEERQQRHYYGPSSVIRFDWDAVLGSVRQKEGEFTKFGRFRLPETETFHPCFAKGASTVALPTQQRNIYLDNLKKLAEAK